MTSLQVDAQDPKKGNYKPLDMLSFAEQLACRLLVSGTSPNKSPVSWSTMSAPRSALTLVKRVRDYDATRSSSEFRPAGCPDRCRAGTLPIRFKELTVPPACQL